jgi:4-amino-4-deoxy-L-arabinose transferase-like glycosyltransferase
LLAFALRVYRLEAQSAWHDETYCVLVAQQPLAQVVAAQSEDIHPPLYFVLLHFWLPLAGHTDFAVRFLSGVFGVLLVALLYRAGAAFYARSVGLLAALLGAVAPFYVAYSQEIRMYALVTLLALTSSYLGYRLLGCKSQIPNPKSQGWLWAGYVLTAAAALYAHYFAALVLVAQNVAFALWVLWLLVSARFQKPAAPRAPLSAVRPWIAAQMTVAVLYVPQLLTATRQLGAYTNPGLNLVPPAEFLRGVWQAFNVGLAVDGGWLAPVLALLALLFFAGLFLLARRGTKTADEQSCLPTVYLLCCFLIPLTMFLIVVLTRPLFHPRFLLVAMPAYTLLLAAGLAALGRLWRPLGVLAVAIVLLASAWGLNGYYHDERFYKADTRAVAGFLREHTTANDLVLVDVEFVLGYYDHGPAPYQYILANDDVTPAELSALCQGKRHLYRVHWQEGVSDPKDLVDYLLRKYGQSLGEWGFRGYQVFGYVIPPNPAFAVGESYVPRADVFDGRLRLEALDYGPMATPGRPAWVALRWRTLSPMPADYKCFVHLRDTAGRQVAGADTLLMNNQRQTTSQMPPGIVFLDYHLLDTPLDIAPGTYTLYAGIYDPAANTRLSVLDANSTPAGTEVVLGTITVNK